MDDSILFFFGKHPGALPIYERFEQRLMDSVSDFYRKVQATQISFYNRHMFACVSFSRIRPKRECPPSFIIVTFGLAHRVSSPRIDVVIEPYPNRWTHHVLISDPNEVDGELMGWIKEAAFFQRQNSPGCRILYQH